MSRCGSRLRWRSRKGAPGVDSLAEYDEEAIFDNPKRGCLVQNQAAWTRRVGKDGAKVRGSSARFGRNERTPFHVPVTTGFVREHGVAEVIGGSRRHVVVDRNGLSSNFVRHP